VQVTSSWADSSAGPNLIDQPAEKTSELRHRVGGNEQLTVLIGDRVNVTIGDGVKAVRSSQRASPLAGSFPPTWCSHPLPKQLRPIASVASMTGATVVWLGVHAMLDRECSGSTSRAPTDNHGTPRGPVSKPAVPESTSVVHGQPEPAGPAYKPAADQKQPLLSRIPHASHAGSFAFGTTSVSVPVVLQRRHAARLTDMSCATDRIAADVLGNIILRG
jgi:hypothetical protein